MDNSRVEWAAEHYRGWLETVDLVPVGRKGRDMSAWTSGSYTLEGDREEDMMLLSSWKWRRLVHRLNDGRD